MSRRFAKLAARTSALLTLDRQIVGIKFLYSPEDYNQSPARAMRAKIAYCVVVKAAMSGRSIKLSREFSGCNGGGRALGLSTPTNAFASGELYHGFGLYKDLSTSKQVADSMTACGKSSYGVMVQPLEMYDDDPPDVVILAADARNAMRIVQAYTYSYGSQPVFKMTGNQAICSECTAHPLEMDQMNISMLCAGTRYLARWKPVEITMGLPFNRFVETVDGLLKTVDAVELDPAKQSIRENLVDHGFPDPNFRFGYTYFTDLEKIKALKRKQQS